LILQARPGAIGEITVGAGAQQKRLLQLIERAIDRRRIGEGTVIGTFAGLGAAVFGDLREVVILGHEDVRERFVVAQQHVVMRFELLDQVLLKQQRFGFRARGEKHHLRCFRDHLGDARGMAAWPRIVRHPVSQVLGLANIEHPMIGIEHPVHTGGPIQHP